MTRAEISKLLDVPLSSCGFARRGSNWNRERGGLVDVVNLQTSKAQHGLTINLGIMHAPTYELVWAKPVAFPIDAADCLYNVRVGELIDDHDRWWPIDDPASGGAMVDCLTAHGLPLFDEVTDLAALERRVEGCRCVNSYGPATLYLVVLKMRRGDIADAERWLDVLAARRRSEVWQDHIDRVRAALG